MRAQTLFAALTGLLCTSYAVEDQARARNDVLSPQPGLAARQEQACDTAASSIISSLPTGTGSFQSIVASLLGTGGVISPTRVCQVISALPGSLESQASSYDNALASWFSSQSSRVESLVSRCSNDSAVQSLESMTSDLAAYASGCNATTTSGSQSTGTGASNSGSTGSTATGTGTGTGSAAGAPRETGVFFGAVAAAGLLGAVAML